MMCLSVFPLKEVKAMYIVTCVNRICNNYVLEQVVQPMGKLKIYVNLATIATERYS